MDIAFILVGLTVLAYVFYKWATANNNYWLDRNVKFFKPYFLVGNMGGFMANWYTWDYFSDYLYNEFPTEK